MTSWFGLLAPSKAIPDHVAPRLHPLVEAGGVEQISRGRGARYILSKKFYDFSGSKGAYTRKRGLDPETNKELIIRHLKHHGRGTILEFEEVQPSLTRYQIDTEPKLPAPPVPTPTGVHIRLPFN